MNILQRIWDLIVTAWALLCGVASYADRQSRAFIRTMLIIIGVEMGLLLIGFVLNLKGLIVFAAIVASLAVLIAWKFSDLAIRIIASAAGRIPIAKSVVPPATDELKKLLPPMVTISLFLAFIASIAAIKGPAYFTWSDLMIWTAVILTTEIFTLYINSKVKMVGWVMIGLMYYLLIGNYLWPIQAQGFVDWVERSTVKKSMVAMENTKDYELVVINNNTPLYELGWGGKFSRAKITTAAETKAKLVGRKDDPTSKEPMYEVILPVQEGVYVGGETLYVPARLTMLAQKKAEASLLYDTIPHVSKGWRVEGTDLIADLQPGEETTKTFHLPEGVSSPRLVFPGGPSVSYCYNLQHLQTIIIEEGDKKTVVNPQDHYDMGAGGEKKFRVTSLKGGATVILNVKRNV